MTTLKGGASLVMSGGLREAVAAKAFGDERFDEIFLASVHQRCR
jgi:hypothetical protein